MELIGEPLSKVRQSAPDIAERIPNVDKIIGMRNILIHGYLVVSSWIGWLAATQQIPELIPVLEGILAELDPGPAG